MKKSNFSFICKSLLLLLCSFSLSHALKVNIIDGLPYVDVDVNGENVRIQRIQDTNHKLKNSYTKTSRPTPPFNIQAFEPIKGVTTVTELDLINFIKDRVSDNEGMVIDARMPKWYQNGTIPGALNIPFSILYGGESNQYITQIFEIFGVETDGENLDFTDAQILLVFDNGPWCQQGVAAMKELIKLGYPKDKILYYRGGMQFWQILGLTVMTPKS